MLLRAKVLLITLLFAGAANAAIWTDLWWNPAESGWGVNVVHQSNVLFLTYFVYAQDGSAKWYSATLFGDAVQPNGYRRYDGDLYETHGPFFGVPFNPTTVTARKVGTTAFVPATFGTAALSYTVDGVSVFKSIQRQTFHHIPLGGNYFGGYSVKVSSCPTVPPGTYGQIALSLYATVNSDGLTGNLSSTITFDNSTTCVLGGTYRQYGSVYSVVNGADCSSSLGQINYTDLSSSDDGLDGNMTIRGFAGCTVGIGFSAARL